MSDELSKLLTLEELMDYLQVSRATIFRLKDQGMPAVKIGAALRFDPTEVQRWIQAKSADAQVPVPAPGESGGVPRVTSVIWQPISGGHEAVYGAGIARVTKDGGRWFYEINDTGKQHESLVGLKDNEREAFALCSDTLVRWAQEAGRAREKERQKMVQGYPVSEEG